MATASYNYDGSDTELYTTNLYAGSDADLDNTAPVDATDGFTATIDGSSKFHTQVEFKFDASGTTDDLVLKLYRSLDSTWDGDEIPIDQVTVSSDGSEDFFIYHIGPSHGPGYYRFSMQSSGATDTFDIIVNMRQADYTVA